MRNCFISRNYKTVKSGGGRVRTDLEKIMTDMGFQNLGLQQSRQHNIVFDLLYTFTTVMKGVMSLRRGDTLVIQYPMKKYYEFVCDMAHRKGVKVVTVIHDLGCFRRKKLTVEREMERLAHSDALIVHNPTMHKWLKDHGYQGEMQIIGLFDYLSPAPITSKRQAPNAPGEYSIFFAGSLTTKHNEFIYMLPEQLKGHKFYLYGAGFREDLAKEELVYKGFAADYELMENNLGDFGLSWYGESLTEGKGMIGEYMAYNNPHKILLYLRC
ncbi:MAG: galactofuranosyltransferase, partial [Prevotella sp.]|nr:galactofuranosyltransferase [Prevotella sp.]